MKMNESMRKIILSFLSGLASWGLRCTLFCVPLAQSLFDSSVNVGGVGREGPSSGKLNEDEPVGASGKMNC